MKKLLPVALVLAAVLVTVPAMAQTIFSDDFSSGNDNGWVRSDGAPFYSVVGGRYVINNFGGGTTYSMRPDVTMPTGWAFGADISVTRPTTGATAAGGLALVGSATNPWNDYLNFNVMLHDTLDLVGLQIHWQTGATSVNWVPYTQGDTVHLEVTRAKGSPLVSAMLTAPGGSLSATSIPVPTKLANDLIPAVQVAGGADATYTFDNVIITPEPSAFLALGLGLSGLMGAALRKRTR